MIDTEAMIGESYHPGYHVAGTELPWRTRLAASGCCTSCEFCIEIGPISTTAPQAPMTSRPADRQIGRVRGGRSRVSAPLPKEPTL